MANFFADHLKNPFQRLGDSNDSIRESKIGFNNAFRSDPANDNLGLDPNRIFTAQDDWKGYLEDRRPASNADPYRIIKRIVETVMEAHEQAV